MVGSAADEDDFKEFGPKHMWSKDGANPKIVIDWDNMEHRRCVAACLVKGTCVMENDRIKCRMYNNNELAPAWWESFGFKLKKPFINDSKKHDQFFYGAIFEVMAPSESESAPKYVVAFRGTMLSLSKVTKELMQDILVLFNALDDGKRFNRTREDVDQLTSNVSSGSIVWLAGHSLGAAMALQIARNLMLDKRRNVPAFLFNPPHVSPAPVINKVLTEEQKTVLYTVSYTVKFVLANLLPGYKSQTEELFEQLAPWVPELYLNPDDWLCRGYIDYFEQRKLVGKYHPRRANTATRASFRDMASFVFSDKSQPHLLPSARLWTSSSQEEEDPHRLRQWWRSYSDLEPLTCTCYGYPVNASAC